MILKSWQKLYYPKHLNPWLFRQAILCYHNHYRMFHGAPNLKLNQELNQRAQKWAKTMAGRRFFGHSPSSGRYVGESIYRGHFLTAGEVVNAFYDEVHVYQFNNPHFSLETGHFTQLVWKGTKEIGVGIASPKNDPTNFYVVVNYTPPGNVNDPKIFAENVLPCAPFNMCHT